MISSLVVFFFFFFREFSFLSVLVCLFNPTKNKQEHTYFHILPKNVICKTTLWDRCICIFVYVCVCLHISENFTTETNEARITKFYGFHIRRIMLAFSTTWSILGIFEVEKSTYKVWRDYLLIAIGRMSSPQKRICIHFVFAHFYRSSKNAAIPLRVK